MLPIHYETERYKEWNHLINASKVWNDEEAAKKVLAQLYALFLSDRIQVSTHGHLLFLFGGDFAFADAA